MGISYPGNFGKDCFDMLKTIGFRDLVRLFSSSWQFDKVYYLGWFVLDLVGRLFRMQAWMWSYWFLSKCCNPYVSPGSTIQVALFWVFLPCFCMLILSLPFLGLGSKSSCLGPGFVYVGQGSRIQFIGSWISFLDSLFFPGWLFCTDGINNCG